MAKPGRKPGTPKTGGRDFKPGQSGNPAGKPPMPPELKAIKALTPGFVKMIIAKFARMSKEEMGQLLMKPPGSEGAPNMMEIMIGSIVAKAAQDGDYSRLNFLLDRSIGKVKEQVDITVAPKMIYKTTMTNDGRLLQDLLKDEDVLEVEAGGRSDNPTDD